MEPTPAPNPKTLDEQYREGTLPGISPLSIDTEHAITEQIFVPPAPADAVTEVDLAMSSAEPSGRVGTLSEVELDLSWEDIRQLANAGDKRIRRARRNLLNQHRSINGQLDAHWRLRHFERVRRSNHGIQGHH